MRGVMRGVMQGVMRAASLRCKQHRSNGMLHTVKASGLRKKTYTPEERRKTTKTEKQARKTTLGATAHKCTGIWRLV